MDLGIAGKVALVGGASKGLGYAAAERLAQEGVKVAMCARNRDALEKSAAELARSSKGEVIALPADLSKADDIVRIVDTTVQRLGGLDILVCNTGGPPVLPIDAIDDDKWVQSFTLVHLSVVRLIRAALPHMRAKHWGRIISIQSSSVKQPVAGLHLSNGVRPAVAGLFKSFMEEWAKDGITANIILPGMFLTDRILNRQTEIAKETNRTLEQCLNALAQQTALRRLGKPEELGSLVAFLASQHASYITGATYQVDGGSIRSNV